MKCYLVQDLLPLYAEKLTSNETNVEIEKHISKCQVCSICLNKIQDNSIKMIIVPDQLYPLKKLQHINVRNCIITALGTLAIIGLIILIF